MALNQQNYQEMILCHQLYDQKTMINSNLTRLANPNEIAPTTLLLASDDGSFYCGATLSPNGSEVMV